MKKSQFVTYECKKCDKAKTYMYEDWNIPKTDKCKGCGEEVGWNRIQVSIVEEKTPSLTIIPPKHEWYDEGAGRVFSGQRAANEYAKRNDKLIMSDKEIAQEAKHHRDRNQREAVASFNKRIETGVRRVLDRHFGGR